MAVVTNKNSSLLGRGMEQDRCTVCDGPLRYPFLVWAGHVKLVICSQCGPNIKNGLAADLIHLTAIVDLQRLGYDQQTLVRKDTAELEAEAVAAENPGAKHMKQCGKKPHSGNERALGG